MGRLQKSSKDRVLAGVCGGLGEYFGIDSIVFRLLFIALAIIYFPASIIIYLIAAVILPQSDESSVRIDFQRIRDIGLGIAMGVIGFWIIIGTLSSGFMNTFNFPGFFNVVAVFITPVVTVVGFTFFLVGLFLVWRSLGRRESPRFKSAAASSS